MRLTLAETTAWIAAALVVAVVLPTMSYGTRDPDSRLYAQIAGQLATQPPRTWIAPVWPAGWYGSGLFVEHPVGVFLAPATLGALGYPAAQAAYLVNALCQIGALLLLAALARRFVPDREARTLLYLIQLIPIAFTYRVRANQEQPLLFLLLLALYATERTRTRWTWALVVPLAFVWLVLVKGMIGLVGFPVCALWLLARGRDDTTRGGQALAWLTLAFSGAAVAAATAAYEALYGRVTGTSFVTAYLRQQMGPAMARQSAALVAQKVYNAVWYAGRLLWFPFPWSLALLIAAGTSAGSWLRHATKPSGPRRGLAFASAVALLYLALFSLSDRRADRYIFPAYFAVAAAGALAATRCYSPAARLVARFERWPRWTPAALWLALVLLHVGAGRLLHLPTIKVWDPSS